MKKYYLIEVKGSVEPVARGPYKTEERRGVQAKQLHRKQEGDDSLFWADINEKGKLTIGPYIASFFLDKSEN